MDYYAVLGIRSDAGDAAIRRAYRSVARRFHPDAGEGSSPEKFRAAVEAYETLSDPARRRAYDQSLEAARPPVVIEPMVGRRAPVYRAYPVHQEPLAAWDSIFDQFDRLVEDFFFRSRRFRW